MLKSLVNSITFSRLIMYSAANIDILFLKSCFSSQISHFSSIIVFGKVDMVMISEDGCPSVFFWVFVFSFFIQRNHYTHFSTLRNYFFFHYCCFLVMFTVMFFCSILLHLDILILLHNNIFSSMVSIFMYFFNSCISSQFSGYLPLSSVQVAFFFFREVVPVFPFRQSCFLEEPGLLLFY